ARRRRTPHYHGGRVPHPVEPGDPHGGHCRRILRGLGPASDRPELRAVHFDLHRQRAATLGRNAAESAPVVDGGPGEGVRNRPCGGAPACWLAGLALVVGALLLTDALLWAPGLTEDNVRRIRPGMTLAEVEGILGQAGASYDCTNLLLVWVQNQD